MKSSLADADRHIEIVCPLLEGLLSFLGGQRRRRAGELFKNALEVPIKGHTYGLGLRTELSLGLRIQFYGYCQCCPAIALGWSDK